MKKSSLIFLGLLLATLSTFAADEIIVPKNTGKAFLKDTHGNLAPFSVGYTTDGNGVLQVIAPGGGGVDDTLILPKNTGSMFLSSGDNLYPASVLYTTDGHGTVVPITLTAGTVTSVGLALPAIFEVSHSPVTGAGTLTGELAPQPVGFVFAGPSAGPSPLPPAFRPLVADDVPNLTAAKVSDFQAAVSGNADVAANTSARHSPVSIDTYGNGLSVAPGQVLSLALADATHTGALSASDFAAFNSKPGAITANTTLTVKASGGDFTTIQDALDSLKGKRINPDVKVTISVDAGTFTSSSYISFSHPNGNRIDIVGAAPVASTVTSLDTYSGSAGNYSVTLNVGSSTGMAAGDYVIVRGSTGTGEHRAIMGVWEVTGVPSGTKLTMKNTYRKAAWPTLTVTGGNVSCLKTILKFTGSDGIRVGGATGYIYNLALVGDGSANDGVNISQRGFAYGTQSVYLGESGGSYSFGVNGFGRYGVAHTAQAQLWALNAAFSGNGSYGVYAYNGSNIAGSGLISSGNGNIGIYATDGAWITAVSSFAVGNTTVGFYANSRAGINAQSSEAVGNIQSGYQANILSSIDATSSKALNNSNSGYKADSGSVIYATGTSAVGNGLAAGQYGYYALNGSTIRANTSTGSGNFAGDYRAESFSMIRVTSYTGSPSFSPALDVIGNSGALIKNLDATVAEAANASSVTGTTVKDALNTVYSGDFTPNGFRLGTSGAQPTCDAAHRGLMWNVQGGAGVADILQVCQKNASDVYGWATH